MSDESLPALVLAQARRTPTAVAVRQWDREVAYAELAGRASVLADRLTAGGAGPGSLVGVCTRRDPEMVVAVLGVLLAGAAYVPLDPAHPPARLLDIAAEAGLAAVVADATGRAALDGADLPLVEVPVEARDLAAVTAGPATRDSLAYVAYTSGSSGRPKGVMVDQHSVVNFVAAARAMTGAGPGDRLLGLTSLSWDAVVIDIFLTLTTGATLQLVPHDDRIDPARLNRFAAAHAATWVVTTPAVLALLNPVELPALRTVVVGGEALPPELVRRWRDRRLHNVYGPTEITVFVLAADLRGAPDGEPPIGVPVGGHRAYVVDETLAEVPPGEVGELLIGGPGVARGYLGRPDLTAERFVPDGFSGRPGARLYRTGDLVRVRPDGQVAFVGRRDSQVKIRGQRIELDEVAAVLHAHPGVGQAAVVAVPGPIGPELVAFVAPADAPPNEELVRHAGLRLTDAMLPRRFVRLATLPATVVGKVDRDALRALVDRDTPPPAPADPLAAAWVRVLGGHPGPDDDFFACGGHSLAAMRLVAELRSEFDRDVSVEDVFAGRTLAGIAERVARAAPLTGPELTTGNPPTLSPSQRRLWFLDQLAPGSGAYNVAFAERLRGPLDVPALRSALRAVANRHDVLRWRIPHEAGVPYAVCDPPADVPLPVVDLTADALPGRLAATAAEAFNLAAGPVWRAVLFRLAADEHVLCVVLHHAVSDGWSQSVLWADLAAAYQGEPLPRPTAGYADYARWRSARDEARAEPDLAWWTAHLADAPTVLDLPRDRPRPAVQTYAGATVSRELPAAADAAVRTVAGAVGATPSVVVLAAFGQALARLTGRDDHVVGAVVADRRLAAFHDLVGFFVDIVPLRLSVGGADSFTTAVRRCLDELLAAQAHPGVPLERVVEALGIPRDPSRPPLVQVLFNVFNFAEPRLVLPGLDVRPVPVPMPGSPFDLTLYLIERDGRFTLDVLFNPDLFHVERIRRLLDDVVTLLGALAAAPSRRPADLGPPFDPTGLGEDRPRPAVGPPAASTGSPDPTTDTERLVASVWGELLDRTHVPATTTFFELGGTSMLLVRASALLTDRLGRRIPVVDLLRYPTVRALAGHLDGAAGDGTLARAAERAALRRRRAGRRPA